MSNERRVPKKPDEMERTVAARACINGVRTSDDRARDLRKRRRARRAT